ncbi:MAG: hydrogenase maturation peptidase HycI [Candidatus Aenigmatarchaeota archaeon]|nr:MAG: hydrogenase maturation peptidase HycI [Candidatus Aenigmarchaeota archaeon]
MRAVVCGIGNVLRGDDAIGPMAIERMRGMFDGVLLVDCGPAPENFAGKIVKEKPSAVIIIDAVEMGDRPGTVKEIPVDKVKAEFATTHKMPITVFIEYLQKNTEADITFIGVQQKSTGFGHEMSDECASSVDDVICMVSKLVA